MKSEETAARPEACRRILALALCLCGVTLGISGCKRRTVQAAPAPPVIVAEPQPQPAPTTTPPEVKPEAKPEVKPESPATTGTTPAPKVNHSAPKPKPPAAETPAPAPAVPATPKPVPPQITLRLSPEELAAYKRHTDEDVGVAERNLQDAERKRPFNSAQDDLAQKVQDFLVQAREASRAGDWPRARNLAEKARVLSVELLKSL